MNQTFSQNNPVPKELVEWQCGVFHDFCVESRLLGKAAGRFEVGLKLGSAPPADVLVGLTVPEDIGIYKGIMESSGKKANGDRLSNMLIL